jgi:hypothetical protein
MMSLVRKQLVTIFFKKLSWMILLPAALFLGLAPFLPEPHLLEKLRMLAAGQLIMPMDIFDLFLHGTPWLLVFGKLLLGRHGQSSKTVSE